jgi:Uma2 family endonuclease
MQQAHGQAVVWPQGNSIRLPDSDSRPQPDLTLLKWRDDLYRGKRPSAEDVILLIEVSDTSLRYDRTDKAKLYAEAGIPEYWLVNVAEHTIEIYTNPGQSKYESFKKAKPGETVPLPAELRGAIKVDDILG